MINIYIESGVNQAGKRGKQTTNEQDFVITFIEHHFSGIKRGIDFEVYGFGGKDALPNNASVLLDSSNCGNLNLVIFDADTTMNGGGFVNRKAEIESVRDANGMNFELFLWPNNCDDGDFETLLIEMVTPSHAGILDCFDNFTKCVGGHDPEGLLYDLPGRKSEIYTYIELMKKRVCDSEAFKKGYWLFDHSDLWNLDAEYAQPFKEFLERWFSK